MATRDPTMVKIHRSKKIHMFILVRRSTMQVESRITIQRPRAAAWVQGSFEVTKRFISRHTFVLELALLESFCRRVAMSPWQRRMLHDVVVFPDDPDDSHSVDHCGS